MNNPELFNEGPRVWVAVRYTRIDGNLVPITGIGKSALKATANLERNEATLAGLCQKHKVPRPAETNENT